MGGPRGGGIYTFKDKHPIVNKKVRKGHTGQQQKMRLLPDYFYKIDTTNCT